MAIIVSNQTPVNDFADVSGCSKKSIALRVVIRCNVEIGFRLNSEQIILDMIKLFRLFILIFGTSFVIYSLIAAGHADLVVEVFLQFILLVVSLTKRGWL